MISDAERQARLEKTKKQILWVGGFAFLFSCLLVFMGVYASYTIHQTDNLKLRLQHAAQQARAAKSAP